MLFGGVRATVNVIDVGSNIVFCIRARKSRNVKINKTFGARVLTEVTFTGFGVSNVITNYAYFVHNLTHVKRIVI